MVFQEAKAKKYKEKKEIGGWTRGGMRFLYVGWEGRKRRGR